MSRWTVRVDRFDDLGARTAYLLWQLRESVFVVEQECPYLELDGRDLEPATRHVWAAPADVQADVQADAPVDVSADAPVDVSADVPADGLPVGYLRVLEDGDRLRIGRVLVAGPHRGLGLAGVLMRRALDVVGSRPSRLDAQSPLAGWYAGFGYRQDGEEFVEDGIPHVPMRRG